MIKFVTSPLPEPVVRHIVSVNEQEFGVDIRIGSTLVMTIKNSGYINRYKVYPKEAAELGLSLNSDGFIRTAAE